MILLDLDTLVFRGVPVTAAAQTSPVLQSVGIESKYDFSSCASVRLRRPDLGKVYRKDLCEKTEMLQQMVLAIHKTLFL